MKKLFAALAMTLAGVTTVFIPFESEAKRLGGGRPAGMQRQMPAKTPDAPPAKPAQPTNATAPAAGAAPAAAAAGKRSWMGPIAGIAAGLGIAALMSHLGMGEAFGNFLTMALLALAAVFVIGWLMRRFKGAQATGPQLAGAGAPYGSPQQAQPQSMQRQAVQPAAFTPGASTSSASAPTTAVAQTPEGFDAAGFERIAKMIFIRLQAANDAGQVDDLRKFTTPELFASLRLDLQERGASPNQTDVVQLDAELVDTAQENGQWVASVRFHGLIREEAEQGAQPFNELWHLVKPLDDSREWAIAGITPLDA
ncbi:MAG TPA: TIM44-like domain-containing protein [Aquabacterium sp.]|uniref:Tim44 domain-containing protein n=1 Tax=Aquabacterium sp. TaxID=1872578 RepID=UPI002E3489A2|nr:TIM44-like domain-containing protein [Aquabacterium sp.]HEX5372677.1 TIM44-like domain-containing protein [Aquabacterium sp.]